MMKTICAALLLTATAIAPTGASAQDRADPAVERIVVGMAQQFATNATNMRPERSARMIPDTQKVVYVNEGHPIRGHEYVKTLSNVYAARQSQRLHWDKYEVTPVGRDGAVFTGWATMSTRSHAGHDQSARYIFTCVFAKTAAGWKRIIAQKALLKE